MSDPAQPFVPLGPWEQCTKAGRLLISARRLMALNALLDTPDGRTSSLAEWQSLVRLYGETLHPDTAHRMPPSWVRLVPLGRRWGVVLEVRGRQILSGMVPLHVRGHGPIERIGDWVGRNNLKRRAKEK